MVGIILEVVDGAMARKQKGDAGGKEDPSQHYYVYQNLVEHQGEIKRLLPPELHEAFNRMGKKYSELYSGRRRCIIGRGLSMRFD
ncbi:MAG: hypothetical protein H6Q67_1373 [Firmicutes bacterium]|nr:hypothetical protein [Bacillota bacterium]